MLCCRVDCRSGIRSDYTLFTHLVDVSNTPYQHTYQHTLSTYSINQPKKQTILTPTIIITPYHHPPFVTLYHHILSSPPPHHPPFSGPNLHPDHQLPDEIIKTNIITGINACTWDPRVSHNAKRIITRVLTRHPQKRPDIQQLETWIQHGEILGDDNEDDKEEDDEGEEEEEEEEEGNWGLGQVYTAPMKGMEGDSLSDTIREGWKLPVMPEAITDIWGNQNTTTNSHNNTTTNQSNTTTSQTTTTNHNKSEKSSGSSVISGASTPRDDEGSLISETTGGTSKNGHNLMLNPMQETQVNKSLYKSLNNWLK